MNSSDNARIEYKIKILKGENKGKTITLLITLDDLEYDDITDILIEKGYIEYSINHEEHDVISRKVFLIHQ